MKFPWLNPTKCCPESHENPMKIHVFHGLRSSGGAPQVTAQWMAFGGGALVFAVVPVAE